MKMTFAYWSIILCAVLAYFTVLYAKFGEGFSNHNPREYLENLKEGKRKRAFWAQQNTLEILPLYIGAIIIGHLQNIDIYILNAIALVFLGSRVLYALAYIYDRPNLRSIIWSVGFGCIIGIFVLAS